MRLALVDCLKPQSAAMKTTLLPYGIRRSEEVGGEVELN